PRSQARTGSWATAFPAAKGAFLVPQPAAVPAHLAAGGLRDAAVLEQPQVVQLYLVPLGHRLADVADQLLDVQLPAAALDLLHHDQAGPAVLLDLEGGPAAPPQPGVDGLDGFLDVPRVMVATADDDEVLDPAGDEQLTFFEEAQVARAQERPLA